MHELDLPRRYRTMIVCGAFGLGGSRDWDRESLRRMRAHLEPGGVLIIDYESRSAGEREWRQWADRKRASLPEPSVAPELVPAADGSEIGLRARIVDIDLATRAVTSEMRAQCWRGGRLEADESYPLKACVYFRDELLALLAEAGFGAVKVSGDTAARTPGRAGFSCSRPGQIRSRRALPTSAAGSATVEDHDPVISARMACASAWGLPFCGGPRSRWACWPPPARNAAGSARRR